MNINLLPNKFIRNRAFEVIFFISLITSVFVMAVCGLGFWYFQTLANNYQNSIMTTQAERIVFQRQLDEMLISKSQDLQAFIGGQKQRKVFTAPVMETFEEAAQEIDVTINSYDLLLNGDEVVFETAQDGTVLFPLVTMAVQGDIYDSLIRVKSVFEEIEWVHHVTYQNLSHDASPPEGRVTVYLSQAQVPQLLEEIDASENEEGVDD